MRALVAMVCGGLLLACSSGGDGARPAPGVGREAVPPLPECPDASYDVCDAAEAECQQHLLALAACLKNTDQVEALQIDLMSPEDYIAILEAELAETPEPEVNHFAQALSGLNLASATGSRSEGIARYVDFVWGVYRDDEKRIVLIDHGEPLDSPSVNGVLLHELIHALQDADYDLSSWPDHATDTFDTLIARATVIEGEARFYQMRALMPLLGLDFNDVDFDAAIDNERELTLDGVFEAPSYADAFTTFPYGVGATLASRAWKANGADGINQLYASPPLTTWEIMAPIFGDVPSFEAVEIPQPDVTSYDLYTLDTLGAWGLNLFLAANGVDRATSLGLSLAWRGDRLWVYADEAAGNTYALWQIELADEDAALEVNRAVPDLFAGVEHGVRGTRVFVSIGTGRSASGPIAELSEWGQAWLSAE